MNARPAALRRGAFTLIELVVAMASSMILLAGIGSTLYMALRAADPANSPAPGHLESLARATDMGADLQFAIAFTEKTANAITATLPDRTDADTNVETVRYSWSGTSGHPLTRTYNGGATINVLASVHSFVVDYYPSSAAPEYITIRIQRTSAVNTTVETSFALLNRP